jgi:LacI family transcriptional regulator
VGNRITIKDIAKETGLSIAAVSYVLNNKEGVGAETRELVMEAVERLGYIPNYTARGLASRRSHLIGICSPQTEPGSRLMFDNPFYSKLFSSIEYECRIRGYHVIISGTDADESFLKLAQQRSLDGMIIIGSYSKGFYSELKKANIPIVLVDTYQNPERFHEVRIDDKLGGYMATKYLIDKGHKKIAFISGALREKGVTQLRFDGYRNALRESGITFEEKLVFPGIVSFQSGVDNAKEVVTNTEGVTAVFCTADIIAMGAIKKVLEMGMKVPDDISIMGFDNLNISEYTSPSITTVSQDIELKGKAAVEIILGEINGEVTEPQCTILPLEIIERQSTKQI